MCNLYSLTKGQAAIRDWFRARHDRTGNLPLLPGIFPDQTAPIVRNDIDGEPPGPPMDLGNMHRNGVHHLSGGSERPRSLLATFNFYVVLIPSNR